MAASIQLVFMLSLFGMHSPTEAQERIGCFSFNHGNTVLSVKAQDVVSIWACIQQCQNRRATYAGVRYDRHCYCGDNHDHTVNGEQLGDSSCTTQCSGDRLPHCGGRYSIVIYSVCGKGRYRDSTNDAPNCDASCYCYNNHTCLYNTGSCAGNCETGWSGKACNWRDMVTKSTGYGVSEHMPVNPALSVTPFDGCHDLLAVLCVTSIGLVISIIVNINLVYRLRVARIPDKQLSANIRATHNSSDSNSNDTQYENMGGVQTEPSNYEHLGSRQKDPATYEELGMAGPTLG